MIEPIRTLGPRTRGDDVRQLHGALLRLGATVAADELIEARFGPATRAAVVEFQRARGLEATGIVEDATVEAMRAALADQPAGFHVVGRVRWAGGQPAAALTVRAYDRDL